LNQHNYTDRIP